MRIGIRAGIILALASGMSLGAQEVNFGLGVILGVPTGALNGKAYPDGVNETYDNGLGAQFTVSWPVAPALAVRLNVSGISFDGTGSAPQTYNWNIEDSILSVGGEAEYFLPGGDAERHRGTYLLGGLHSDFERFSASDYDPAYFAAATVNKTRLAGTLGIGHTFRFFGGNRWSLEAAYHKTLTGTDSNDSALVGFPASDYIKLYVGCGF